MRKARKSQSG